MARSPLGALESAVMNPKTLLFLALALVTVWFLTAWWWQVRAARPGRSTDDLPATGFHAVVGFVMCFFDTLGIGNFATTTSMFKLRHSVRDEWIPGTLNVAYTLPTVAQAFIYISIVRVDFLTLVTMIGASVAGAWLGAGVVARWPRMKIQVGMGFALLAAAAVMLLTQLQLVPVGGLALALRGPALIAGDQPVTEDQVRKKLQSDGWSNVQIVRDGRSIEAIGSKDGQTGKVVVNAQNGRLRATDDDDDD